MAAVVVNFAVGNQQAAGYGVRWPSDGTMPVESSINWTPGTVVSNLAMVKVGADGAVKFTNASVGTVDVILDAGWYATAGRP